MDTSESSSIRQLSITKLKKSTEKNQQVENTNIWQLYIFAKGLFLEILNKHNIRGLDKVRMVGRDSNEIIPIDDALALADNQGLDLILVSKDVSPPVVRIQDLKKIEYEKKKAKKKRPTATTSVKEMRFLVNISENDLSIKIAKINKFLQSGNKVKVSVKLKGRERERPQRAFELIQKIADSAVECRVNKIPGNIAMALLEPVKEKK